MNVSDIMIETGATREIVEDALLTSGFPIGDDLNYKRDEVRIAKLYIRYLMMMRDAEESSLWFKYHDGEEGIDKTLVNDNIRRTAMIWYDRWEKEMKKYKDKQDRAQYSNFYIRRRA